MNKYHPYVVLLYYTNVRNNSQLTKEGDTMTGPCIIHSYIEFIHDYIGFIHGYIESVE